jgi:hypothetical protein
MCVKEEDLYVRVCLLGCVMFLMLIGYKEKRVQQ